MRAVARERQPDRRLHARTRGEAARSPIRAQRKDGKENRRGGRHDAITGRTNPPARLRSSRAAAGVCAPAALCAFRASWDVRAVESGSGASSPGPSLAGAVVPALHDSRRSIDTRLNRVVNQFSLRAAGNRLRPRIAAGPCVERTGSVPRSTGESGTAGRAPVPARRGRTGKGGGGTFVRDDGAGGRAAGAGADSRSRELGGA